MELTNRLIPKEVIEFSSNAGEEPLIAGHRLFHGYRFVRIGMGRVVISYMSQGSSKVYEQEFSAVFFERMLKEGKIRGTCRFRTKKLRYSDML